MQGERKGVVPICLIVLARHGRCYLPSFIMEGAALQKIVPWQMVTENWSFVLVVEDRRQKVVDK